MRKEYQWQWLIECEFEDMKARDYSLREEMKNSNCFKGEVTRSQNVKDLNFTGVEWQEYFFLNGRKCDTNSHQNRFQISVDISLLQLEFTFAIIICWVECQCASAWFFCPILWVKCALGFRYLDLQEITG